MAYYVFRPSTGATESGQQRVQPTVNQPVQKPQPTAQPIIQPAVQPFPQVERLAAPQQSASLYGGNAQQGLVSPGDTRTTPQTVQLLPSQPKPVLAQSTSSGNPKQDFTKWLTAQFVDKYNGNPGGWIQLSEPQAEQVRSVLPTQIKGIDKNSVVQKRIVKGQLKGPGREPYAILKSHLDEAVKQLV